MVNQTFVVIRLTTLIKINTLKCPLFHKEYFGCIFMCYTRDTRTMWIRNEGRDDDMIKKLIKIVEN